MPPEPGPEAAKPPAHVPARRVLVSYYARCRGCGWDEGRDPHAARVHSASEGHSVTETKHYVVEPTR